MNTEDTGGEVRLSEGLGREHERKNMSLSTCEKCGGHIPLGPDATNRCEKCGAGVFGPWSELAPVARVEKHTGQFKDMAILIWLGEQPAEGTILYAKRAV